MALHPTDALGEHAHSVAEPHSARFGEDTGATELRRQTYAILQERVRGIASDALAIFPYSGTDTPDPEQSRRLAELLVHCLAAAARDGLVDARSGLIADIHRVVSERGLPLERLFTLQYLIERSAIDELSLHEAVGASTDRWPSATQLLRRASFAVLAAYAERAQGEGSGAGIVDKLTTLHTRAVLDAVLSKEVERAARIGYPISLILFDVDLLSSINKAQGYGVGDKVLERLGILIRQYFRRHDWVARHSEDSIAVLLTHTDGDAAAELAERVRSTIADRLGFTDHRSEQPVPITISAAVVNVQIAEGDLIDATRLMADAELAMERAKEHGRNRVERVDGQSSVLRRERV